MLVVTHEMAFARDVSNHVVFMRDRGHLGGRRPPADLCRPPAAGDQDFLSRFMER